MRPSFVFSVFPHVGGSKMYGLDAVFVFLEFNFRSQKINKGKPNKANRKD